MSEQHNTIVNLDEKIDKSIAHNTRIDFRDVDEEQIVLIYVNSDKRLQKYKQYGIQTENKMIVECVKNFWKLKLRGEIDGYGDNVLKAIKKYSVKRIDIEREKDSEIYDEWCCDVLLFYCWRKVMESKLIPICFLKESLIN